MALIGALMLSAVMINGCTQGLNLGQNGRYFRCTLNKDFQSATIQTIGVYVFSNGEFIRPSTLAPDLFSDEVTRDSKFYPDTSNAIPSQALAEALREELDSRGYNVKVERGLGHSKTITASDCLANARANNYDAIFITYYTGISPLEPYTKGSIHLSSLILDDLARADAIFSRGYLFIPNSALLDARTGDILWSNSYYGIAQNAHVVNLSNQPFTITVPEIITESAEESCTKAARKTVATIFDRASWRDVFKEFPSKGGKRKRM